MQSGNPYYLTVVEHIYQRVLDNVLAVETVLESLWWGGNYCMPLKKWLTNIYLGGADRLLLEYTFHSFSKLILGFTLCAVYYCLGPLLFLILFLFIKKPAKLLLPKNNFTWCQLTCSPGTQEFQGFLLSNHPRRHK